MLAPDGKERKALRRRLLLLLLLLLLPPVLRHDRKRDPTSSLCFLKALLLSEQPTDRPRKILEKEEVPKTCNFQGEGFAGAALRFVTVV